MNTTFLEIGGKTWVYSFRDGGKLKMSRYLAKIIFWVSREGIDFRGDSVLY